MVAFIFRMKPSTSVSSGYATEEEDDPDEPATLQKIEGAQAKYYFYCTMSIIFYFYVLCV